MLKTTMTFVAGFVVAAITLGLAMAAGGDDELRVQARRLDDGRVEVAIQQSAGGEWGERSLPDSRFLPADAAPGRWHSSSAVALAPTESDQAATETVAESEDELWCLVTHEHPGDEAFWNTVRRAASSRRWSVDGLGIDVRVVANPVPSGQAQLVRDCVAAGAGAIATTLAAPDALADALAEAREAGVVVASFNSGRDDFRRVGSLFHVSVDEHRLGSRAAQRFVDAGITGTVLCVIHEEENIGLEERCNGFESGYPGQLERFTVNETGVSDLAATQASIAGRLRADSGQTPVAGVITLNARISLAALAAIDTEASSAVLATFDINIAALEALRDGKLLFTVNTNPYHQSWLVLSALRAAVAAYRNLLADYGVDPAGFQPQLQITLEAPILSTPQEAIDRISILSANARRFNPPSDSAANDE